MGHYIENREDVTKNFGSLTAGDHVSLRVEENEILGMNLSTNRNVYLTLKV